MTDAIARVNEVSAQTTVTESALALTVTTQFLRMGKHSRGVAIVVHPFEVSFIGGRLYPGWRR